MAGSRLVCPICAEDMVTLLQLNRHIDDSHANLEVSEQDEAKTWFTQQMVKAKKFQPLQLLNQKLRGLEVFESNNEPQRQRTTSPRPLEMVVDPEDVVTKTHWQRPTGYDACSDPLCGKRLGAANGIVNCRHCGKLFCEEHTMYQMKLSRSAQHEPVRGLWYRVCETCYKSRDGYNDHHGQEQNHTSFFTSGRAKRIDKQNLETSRLESRLTRLTRLLADPQSDPEQSIWTMIAGNKSHIRYLEQTVVSWQNDADVVECPFCQQPFSQYLLRRHHCRTCGRVVCGESPTACSSKVGLDVDTVTDSEKVTPKVVEVRLCRDCHRTIFSKADFQRDIATETPLERSYNHLVQFEHGIRLLLPKFQRLITALQDTSKPPSHAQLSDASKLRKRLTDSFTRYDLAARKLRDLETDSPTQQRVQKAIYAKATNFLHVHMLPLKALPKTLKHAEVQGRQAFGGSSSNTLAHIRPGSSRASSTTSSALYTLEKEEKTLNERLIVLEEQKFFVSEMITKAQRKREFDKISTLTQNAQDLSQEVDRIQGQLAQMDFAAAYNVDIAE
ncbi:hypothetical protein K470DRAFT_169942 [Piedraia hortae CBS 480.64]|uniref:FYVE-type domain-containing protein n=1 Tax=Piedraia hortae CBS 480.64 TaxID=1314780 RepID=A0A6A7BQJ3_9PEZI|nr:hypothetical protein K470DRAFT_169942 [Piedraia hortae CBS 480.64]